MPSPVPERATTTTDTRRRRDVGRGPSRGPDPAAWPATRRRLLTALVVLAVVLVLRAWLPDGAWPPGASAPAGGRDGWRVERVNDGDTVTCTDPAGRSRRIRLVGIDAPELDQPSGRAAQAALAAKVRGRTIGVTDSGVDQHGRILGTLWLDGRDLNHELVAEGWAWVYAGFAPPAGLLAAEEAARRGRLGLWAEARPQRPREWRQLHPSHH